MISTATEPWLSGNMLQNIKTLQNGRSNFSEKLRIVTLKSPELARSYLQIYQFKGYLPEFFAVLGVRCDLDIFKPINSAQSINREVYGEDKQKANFHSINHTDFLRTSGNQEH